MDFRPAFVLCKRNAGENAVNWKDNHAEVLYIDRLGVNVKYTKKGMVFTTKYLMMVLYCVSMGMK